MTWSRVTALLGRLPLLTVCLAGVLLAPAGDTVASPLRQAKSFRHDAGGLPVVEVAKKRKRKAKRAKPAEDEASTSALVAGANETLVSGTHAEALVKPLTPAESYRAGQSAFFEITVARRKGVRAKTAIIDLGGDGVTVSVTAPKGMVKTKAGKATLTVPLGSGRQSFFFEARLGASPAAGLAQSLVSRLRIAMRGEKEDAKITEAILTFPLSDCTTTYHTALGNLYASRQARLDDAIRMASAGDESLPGRWLFPPRKLSKEELEPRIAMLPPPKRECRWAVETVSFSTKKQERLCKRWALTEIAVAPSQPKIPAVDERRAQAINKRASNFVESRAAASDFGKSGRLEWISKRILTDIKTYLQQDPHPALCAGADVMTSYFVDNAVTLRKELMASAVALEEARGIARTRLEALAMLLGVPPDKPAETASISLITTASAAPIAELNATHLAGLAARMLLPVSDHPVISAAGTPHATLARLAEQLEATPSFGRPDAAKNYLIDALTAVEAVAYLEASNARYEAVGEAIFGSVSLINKAHGETCRCVE